MACAITGLLFLPDNYNIVIKRRWKKTNTAGKIKEIYIKYNVVKKRIMNPLLKKEYFKKRVKGEVKSLFRTTLVEATTHQVYLAVCSAVKDIIIDDWMKTQKATTKEDPKIVYYMSMEFLTGCYPGNNLLNLGAYGEVGGR